MGFLRFRRHRPGEGRGVVKAPAWWIWVTISCEVEEFKILLRTELSEGGPRRGLEVDARSPRCEARAERVAKPNEVLGRRAEGSGGRVSTQERRYEGGGMSRAQTSSEARVETRR